MEAEGVKFVVQHRGRQELSGGQAAEGIRRRRALHRRDQAARSADRRPRAQGHPLRDGFPAPRTRKSLLDSSHKNGNFISAEGKDVIVIGGGDTGTDCVGTSMRHGCRSLVQVEILPKPPPDARRGQSLAGMAEGLQAGLRPGRSRREIRRRPARLLRHHARSSSATTNGHVKEIHTVQIEWAKREGPVRPKEVPGTRADLARAARPARDGLPRPRAQRLLEELASTLDARSNVKADPATGTTSVPGVFAAGDCRRGQSLVVWAINEGRGAAARPIATCGRPRGAWWLRRTCRAAGAGISDAIRAGAEGTATHPFSARVLGRQHHRALPRSGAEGDPSPQGVKSPTSVTRRPRRPTSW